jgi:hypothetical protein
MGKKSDELIEQEIHLNRILDSLYFKQVQDIKNPFIADKKRLIFKIVDNCKVTESIAKKYLNILESRNFIEISDNSVYYNQKKFDERKNKEIDEMNKFFKNMKGG